jgi:hypothetical protein
MDFKKKYTYFNAQTWDRWVDEGNDMSLLLSLRVLLNEII